VTRGPSGIGPAPLPTSARDARLLLRETDLDKEAGELLRVCRKLRRRLERSLETLCPVPAGAPPDHVVPPPPLAWTEGFSALGTTMRGLLQHQRDGQKIQLAAIKLKDKLGDGDLTPEELEEEERELAAEVLEAMSADEVRALLERKQQRELAPAGVEV
jgi:hypothetical protein